MLDAVFTADAIMAILRPDVYIFQRQHRGYSPLPKVSLEVGWLSLAHNLLKKAAVDLKHEMTAQG